VREDQLAGAVALLAYRGTYDRDRSGAPTSNALLGAMMEAEFQATMLVAIKKLFEKG
jgi:hypothetical protein